MKYRKGCSDVVCLRPFRRASDLLVFLERGGNLILCAEPSQPWLPFMAPFLNKHQGTALQRLSMGELLI